MKNVNLYNFLRVLIVLYIALEATNRLTVGTILNIPAVLGICVWITLRVAKLWQGVYPVFTTENVFRFCFGMKLAEQK